MDPVEERDLMKILSSLDDPRVQEKIAGAFYALPIGDGLFKLVPKKNVVQSEKENE